MVFWIVLLVVAGYIAGGVFASALVFMEPAKTKKWYIIKVLSVVFWPVALVLAGIFFVIALIVLGLEEMLEGVWTNIRKGFQRR